MAFEGAKGLVVALPEKTESEFGYKISDLHPGTHKRAWFLCTTCETEILREFKDAYKKHVCPRHRTRSGQDEKRCNRCKTWKPLLKDFFKNSASPDGHTQKCKPCFSKDSVKARSKACKENIEAWIRRGCSARKARASSRAIPHSLTPEFLIELWKKQEGRCFYTKVPLEFGKPSLRSASLDRVDSALGYTADNVVWSSKAMNHMKNVASREDVEQFLIGASSVIEFGLPTFEFAKVHPDAKLPARGKPMDACQDVYAVEDVLLQARSVTDVKTGIHISPPVGFYMTIEGRSSLFKYGIEPLRGIIDATYTGELVVTLSNTSDKAYAIRKGDRVAQIAIHRVIHAQFVLVENIGSFSLPHRTRGIAGFGSSGR